MRGDRTARPAAAASRRAGSSRLASRRGLLLAFAAGIAAALAHPPFGLWPGVFGFGLMLLALDRVPAERPLRAAFFRGWAAGFGYLLVGTWWVSEAFFVDPVQHGWQAPFAVLFTAGGISIFWGGAGLAYRLIAAPGAARVLTFASVLTGFEWLRGHVLTGFPWDLPGECWRAGSAPSQAASLLGAYGLTFVTVAIGAAAVLLLDPSVRRRGLPPRANLVGLVAAAAALALLWGFGAWRLSHAVQGDSGVRVRIVQPGLGEEATWTEANSRLRFDRFIQLTSLPAAHPIDVVIWPEGAVPYSLNDYLAPGTWTEQALERALRPDQTLIVGGTREARNPQGGSQPLYFNSLMAVRRTASGLRILAVYDKYRLVPFGEFLPMRPLFARLGITNLVQAGEDFTPGPPPAPIAIPPLPRVQPLICYESLFPGFTSDKGGRPAWIVNISDDAWFGRTTGPLQHLNLASYRAIEEGLPIIRSTPTGVSAVVDAYGRPQSTLGLGRAGALDSSIPLAIKYTGYARLRNGPLCVLLILGLIPGLIEKRRCQQALQ